MTPLWKLPKYQRRPILRQLAVLKNELELIKVPINFNRRIITFHENMLPNDNQEKKIDRINTIEKLKKRINELEIQYWQINTKIKTFIEKYQI